MIKKFLLLSSLFISSTLFSDNQSIPEEKPVNISSLLGNFKDSSGSRYLILTDGSYWRAYEPLWGSPHLANWQKTHRIAFKKSDSVSYTYKLVNLENGEEAYVYQFDPLLDLNAKLQTIIEALNTILNLKTPPRK